MIRQADSVEVEVSPSNRSGWAKCIGQCALSVALVVVAYLFYLSRQQPQTWEVERITEPPRMYLFGTSPVLAVYVFSPETGEWTPVVRDKVRAGQEFIFSGSLCKQVGVGYAEVYDQNDVTTLKDSYCVYDPHRSRIPTANDSVYVLDRKLPRRFWPLAYVGPGERVHFQGRIYETEAGSEPNILVIRDTGEIVRELVPLDQQHAKGRDHGDRHET